MNVNVSLSNSLVKIIRFGFTPRGQGGGPPPVVPTTGGGPEDIGGNISIINMLSGKYRKARILAHPEFGTTIYNKEFDPPF